MTRSKTALLIGATFLLHALSARGSATEPDDHSKPQAWLCHPDLATGACHGPLNLLLVPPNGRVELTFDRNRCSRSSGIRTQIYHADDKAKIDCFYVYPTSSEDRTLNSDMTPGREIEVTASQFGEFGAHCRQFAPLYRSVTLFALLRARLGTEVDSADWDLAYHDVLDAWHHYLAHDNHGRGVVLVRHSQGSNMLVRLLREEIDGKPAQKHLVSALIAGWPVEVPPGKDVGGTFQALKLCTRTGQFGCVINWSSSRAAVPPAKHPPSTFGRGADAFRAGCTNPAALGSDKKIALDSYFLRGDTNWTASTPTMSASRASRPVNA